MKTQSNTTLEGACIRGVVGGLLLWNGESLQALLSVHKKGIYRPERPPVYLIGECGDVFERPS